MTIRHSIGEVAAAPVRLFRQIFLAYLRGHRSRESATALSRIAWQEIAANRYTGAARYAESAIAADDTWTEGHRMLGLAHLRKGDSARARAAYERGLQQAPDDVQLLTYVGDLEAELKRYTEAEARYRRVVGMAEGHAELPEFRIKLAMAVLQQGRIEEAAGILDEARGLAPEHVRLLLAHGEVRLRQGRYEEALADFQEATGRDPSSPRGYLDLAYALADLGRLDAAVAAATRSAELEPGNRDTKQFLAQLERRRASAG